MAAMMDARCRCGQHIGWAGRMTDRPECPACGDRPSQEDLEAAGQYLEKVGHQAAQEAAQRDDRARELEERLRGFLQAWQGISTETANLMDTNEAMKIQHQANLARALLARIDKEG